MSHFTVLPVGKLLVAALLLVMLSTVGAEPDQAWISPSSVPGDYAPEDFSAERYVWANLSTGVGSRRYGPMLHIDSKGSMWIFGGSSDINFNAMWNYNPVTDLYRWVAGSSNSTEQYMNLGQMGIPGDDVFPGLVDVSANAIDYNDNIWIYGCETFPGNANRFWMFNTTSLQFTWLGGNDSNINPIYGELGVASPEFWPGQNEGACMVVDSKNNLWMLGGYYANSVHNAVWHYNTTSRMWSLQHGTPESNDQYPDFNNNIWPGRWSAGCTIDEDDRIWIFGGYAETTPYNNWNDMWSFDTKTVAWRAELGFDSSLHAGSVVSFDTFHAENFPAGRDWASMVDRRDGTIMMYGGNVRVPSGSFHDIWVFNKTSKLWKIVYGSGNNGTTVESSFGAYREIGSKLGSRQGYGIEQGLTSGGNLVIFGGEDDARFIFNDIWIIPQDMCQVGTHDCDPNASCAMGEWSYTCTCNEGYSGDGKTCTPPPSSAPVASTPSASPKGNTSAGSVVSIALATGVVVLLAIVL